MTEQWLPAAEVIRAINATVFILDAQKARLRIVLQCKPWYKRLFLGRRGPWWKRTKVPPSYGDLMFYVEPTKYRLWDLLGEAKEAVKLLESSTIPVSENDFVDIKNQHTRIV